MVQTSERDWPGASYLLMIILYMGGAGMSDIEVNPWRCQQAATSLAITSIKAMADAFKAWTGSISQSLGKGQAILNTELAAYFSLSGRTQSAPAAAAEDGIPRATANNAAIMNRFNDKGFSFECTLL